MPPLAIREGEIGVAGKLQNMVYALVTNHDWIVLKPQLYDDAIRCNKESCNVVVSVVNNVQRRAPFYVFEASMLLQTLLRQTVLILIHRWRTHAFAVDYVPVSTVPLDAGGAANGQ